MLSAAKEFEASAARAVERALDVGCGTGATTVQLAGVAGRDHGALRPAIAANVLHATREPAVVDETHAPVGQAGERVGGLRVGAVHAGIQQQARPVF